MMVLRDLTAWERLAKQAQPAVQEVVLQWSTEVLPSPVAGRCSG